MDKVGPDMVNLHDTQVGQTDVTRVHLRATQEDAKMLKPEVVDRIRELSGQGLGSKRIARELGVSRNSVRRYLAGAMVGFQERPAARRLDDPTLEEVHRLYRTLAEGNAVVIQQELATRGVDVDLRTLQRAVASLRQEDRARALATVRFETPPGQQMQIDFGEKVVTIAGQPVTVHLMTVVLGYSRRLYCRAFLARATRRLARGPRRSLPTFRRAYRADPLRQRLAAGDLPRSPDRPGRLASRLRDLLPGPWDHRQSLPSAPRPDQGEDRTGRRLRQAQWPGGAVVRVVRGICSVTWRGGWSRSPISGSMAPPRKSPCVRFERDERQALRPLPARPLAVRTRRLTRRVSADCFVDIDTIRYSVPHRTSAKPSRWWSEQERGGLAPRALHRQPRAVLSSPTRGSATRPISRALYRSEADRHAPAPAAPEVAACRPGRCRSTPRSWKEVGHEHGLDPMEERVFPLKRLQLTHLRETLPAVLSEAAKEEWTYLEFLDRILQREVDSKQGKRVRMGLQIAHFPCVRTLEEFHFSFQPSVDERLIRELATGNFISHGEAVLMFGPPGVGKTHLAIGLGRKIVEQGHTVRFTTATALLSTLGKAESEGMLAEKLTEFAKPRLLIIDELGYLPFERRAAHLFFQLVNRRYEKGSLLITTNQRVSEWGTVFGDEVLATAILDRLLHHSHTLMITGESYRLREKRKSGLIRSRLANIDPESAHPETEVNIEKGSERDGKNR